MTNRRRTRLIALLVALAGSLAFAASASAYLKPSTEWWANWQSWHQRVYATEQQRYLGSTTFGTAGLNRRATLQTCDEARDGRWVRSEVSWADPSTPTWHHDSLTFGGSGLCNSKYLALPAQRVQVHFRTCVQELGCGGWYLDAVSRR